MRAKMKATERQLAGLKARSCHLREETITKANDAIDRLKRQKKPVNFETVAKEAGLARSTLYKNARIKERITSLRDGPVGAIIEREPVTDKEVLQMQKEKIVSLREKIKQLETDKDKLIHQLVEMEELKQENERLRKQLVKKI